MREDLGTWTSAQADVLVGVLEDAGLEPAAEPAGGEVRVTVPAAQRERAQRVMAEAMERIAAAAGRPAPREPRWYERDDDEEEGPPLLFERLRRWGGGLAVLVAALMVAIMVPGWFKAVAALVALVTIVAFRRLGS